MWLLLCQLQPFGVSYSLILHIAGFVLCSVRCDVCHMCGYVVAVGHACACDSMLGNLGNIYGHVQYSKFGARSYDNTSYDVAQMLIGNSAEIGRAHV